MATLRLVRLAFESFSFPNSLQRIRGDVRDLITVNERTSSRELGQWGKRMIIDELSPTDDLSQTPETRRLRARISGPCIQWLSFVG
jgi:hypothetical protein